MKRKMLVFIMAACLAVGVTACGGGDSGKKEDKKTEDTGKKEEKKEEKQVKVDAINLTTSNGSTLVYTAHELTQDYQGNNAVRIYFTFTNKEEGAKMVQFVFTPKVFQNGVECEMATGDVMNPNEAEKNLIKEILPDASLDVAFLYSVPDPAAPVTLRVCDMAGLITDEYQEQEITLQ